MSRPKWRHRPARKGLARAKEERLEWARRLEREEELTPDSEEESQPKDEEMATGTKQKLTMLFKKASWRALTLGGKYDVDDKLVMLESPDGAHYAVDLSDGKIYRQVAKGSDTMTSDRLDNCVHHHWLKNALTKEIPGGAIALARAAGTAPPAEEDEDGSESSRRELNFGTLRGTARVKLIEERRVSVLVTAEDFLNMLACIGAGEVPETASVSLGGNGPITIGEDPSKVILTLHWNERFEAEA